MRERDRRKRDGRKRDVWERYQHLIQNCRDDASGSDKRPCNHTLNKMASVALKNLWYYRNTRNNMALSLKTVARTERHRGGTEGCCASLGLLWDDRIGRNHNSLLTEHVGP